MVLFDMKESSNGVKLWYDDDDDDDCSKWILIGFVLEYFFLILGIISHCGGGYCRGWRGSGEVGVGIQKAKIVPRL